jgi:hypothetical protein
MVETINSYIVYTRIAENGFYRDAYATIFSYISEINFVGITVEIVF